MKKGVYMLLLFSVCLLGQSCRKVKTFEQSSLPFELFADGDLAFRRGVGLMSRIVLTAGDGDGTYSHVGILKRVDSVWCVVHAVPDEPDFEGDVDRVKVEPLTRFFASDKAVRGAVMRLADDSLAACRAAWEALRVAERGMLFDHRYNLSDTTEMYCTELVEFVYQKTGVCLSEGRFSEVDIPVWGGKYLLPDDLVANRRLEVIYQFSK